MRALLSIAILMCGAAMASAAETFKSEVVGADLPVRVMRPSEPAPKAGYRTVVVLDNLPGRDVADTSALEKAGFAVVVVDYAKAPAATASAMAIDVLKLRRDLTDNRTRVLLPDLPVDPNRLFIVPAGYAIRENVELTNAGDRVIAADILYPIKTDKPVPLLVEVTCDNANRMGSGSLLYCRDTLLETGVLHGFAVAMMDHPVPPPYKGIDDLPANRETMRRAISRLREVGKELGLSGKIGVMGFSRGATMAAAVASDRSLVQAALVHGNRFDYTRLRPDDPMLKRFEKAWGPLADNRDKWQAQSAMHYLTKDAAAMFLNTSDAESAEYREGLSQLDQRLTELGVEHVYRVDQDGRGHRVTTDPERLAEIMAFFGKHLR